MFLTLYLHYFVFLLQNNLKDKYFQGAYCLLFEKLDDLDMFLHQVSKFVHFFTRSSESGGKKSQFSVTCDCRWWDCRQERCQVHSTGGGSVQLCAFFLIAWHYLVQNIVNIKAMRKLHNGCSYQQFFTWNFLFSS